MKSGLQKERIAFLARDYSRGFIKHCQFEPDVIERGYFQSRVVIREHHRQQDGFIHAGVIATMADHTAGYAAYTTVSEGFRILTIEFKINFFKPAVGKQIICRSKVVNNGKKIKVSESELFSLNADQEKLIAKAMVTLIAVPSSNIK